MSADLAIGSPRTQSATDGPRARPSAEVAAEAAHLAPETMPRWRAQLEFHWRSRLERVTELSLAYHDAQEAGAGSVGVGSVGAGSVGVSPRARQAKPLLRQAAAERRALAEIEAALTRLASGCFGRCERCRSPISAARLTQIPEARHCAACDR
jgi:hypothetical protein